MNHLDRMLQRVGVLCTNVHLLSPSLAIQNHYPKARTPNAIYLTRPQEPARRDLGCEDESSAVRKRTSKGRISLYHSLIWLS